MKIGLVFDATLDRPDGVQQYVMIVGDWLAKQGHEVHYLVGETERVDLPNIHSLTRNIKVRFNQNRMATPLPASAKKIRALLDKEKFDVLHVQVPYSPLLAGRIIKAADNNTAVTGMFHILPYSKVVTAANHALGRWVRMQGSLQRFDALLATSKPAAKFAKSTLGITAKVLGLPINLDSFVKARPFDAYKSGKTVMFLGRLVERKGCQYLLQAVNYAIQNGTWPKDARVVVCGAGHLENNLKKYVADCGFADRVEFAGFIAEEDKPRYLASADVVAYPSTGGESFGIVLLEAMAASKGVVLAGDNPGYASVMAPRPDSLFDPRSAKELAAKIVQALTDKELARTAAAWQQEYVKQFDINAVGKRTIEVFERALHKRRG